MHEPDIAFRPAGGSITWPDGIAGHCLVEQRRGQKKREKDIIITREPSCRFFPFPFFFFLTEIQVERAQMADALDIYIIQVFSYISFFIYLRWQQKSHKHSFVLAGSGILSRVEKMPNVWKAPKLNLGDWKRGEATFLAAPSRRRYEWQSAAHASSRTECFQHTLNFRATAPGSASRAGRKKYI